VLSACMWCESLCASGAGQCRRTCSAVPSALLQCGKESVVEYIRCWLITGKDEGCKWRVLCILRYFTRWYRWRNLRRFFCRLVIWYFLCRCGETWRKAICVRIMGIPVKAMSKSSLIMHRGSFVNIPHFN